MTNSKMTLTQARALCMAVLGSAKGLETVERGLEYTCKVGAVQAQIVWMPCNMAMVRVKLDCATGAVESLYDLTTMQPDQLASDNLKRQRDGDSLRDWVWEIGYERCMQQIKKIWDARWNDR